MNCEQAKSLLSEYIDGELPAAEDTAVKKHLARCEACRAEFEALERTVALVRSLPRAEAPEGLERDIKVALDRRAARRRSAIFRWAKVGTWLAAAATLVVVIKYSPPEAPREAQPPLGGRETLLRAKGSDAAKKPETLRAGEDSKLGVAGAVAEKERPRALRKVGASAPRTEKHAAGLMRRNAAKAASGEPPSLKARGAPETENSAAEPAAPARLELIYDCDAAKSGLADVRQAVNALHGKTLETNKRALLQNHILAAGPRDKLDQLIATLKLSKKVQKELQERERQVPQTAQSAPDNAGAQKAPPPPVQVKIILRVRAGE